MLKRVPNLFWGAPYTEQGATLSMFPCYLSPVFGLAASPCLAFAPEGGCCVASCPKLGTFSSQHLKSSCSMGNEQKRASQAIVPSKTCWRTDACKQPVFFQNTSTHALNTAHGKKSKQTKRQTEAGSIHIYIYAYTYIY